MSIQVLLSTMNQLNLDIAKKCNIQTEAVIVNQCDHDSYVEENKDYGILSMYNSSERGLSKSRNLALDKASAEICILCDDDVQYVNGYEEIVESAFKNIEDADVIVFNIKPINARVGEEEVVFSEIKKIPKYKSYGSVHIAFRRERIIRAGIKFNEYFGTGSGVYPMSEDSIFFAELHRKGLNCYTYPACIATVDFKSSSWFKGYDEEYFYGIGAFLSEAYPKEMKILKWYYPIRMRKLTTLSSCKIIQLINQGIKGYKDLMNYEEYLYKKKKKER